MVHPAVPTPPNDGVSLTGPRRTAPTHLLVLAHTTLVLPPPTRIHALNLGAVGPLSRPTLRHARPGCTTSSFRCAITLKRQRGDHKEAATGWQPHYSSAKVMKRYINAAKKEKKQTRGVLSQLLHLASSKLHLF